MKTIEELLEQFPDATALSINQLMAEQRAQADLQLRISLHDESVKMNRECGIRHEAWVEANNTTHELIREQTKVFRDIAHSLASYPTGI